MISVFSRAASAAANVVLPDRVVKASLLLQEGKIAGIFEGTPAPEGCTVVDAEGKMVLPGLIDTHVHMTDPGPFNYREDWAHGSRCAASGGITTIAEIGRASCRERV